MYGALSYKGWVIFVHSTNGPQKCGRWKLLTVSQNPFWPPNKKHNFTLIKQKPIHQNIQAMLIFGPIYHSSPTYNRIAITTGTLHELSNFRWYQNYHRSRHGPRVRCHPLRRWMDARTCHTRGFVKKNKIFLVGNETIRVNDWETVTWIDWDSAWLKLKSWTLTFELGSRKYTFQFIFGKYSKNQLLDCIASG